jgi:hypothetical protein
MPQRCKHGITGDSVESVAKVRGTVAGFPCF